MFELMQLCYAINKRAEWEKKAYFIDAAGKVYIRNDQDYQTYLFWCEQVNSLRG